VNRPGAARWSSAALRLLWVSAVAGCAASVAVGAAGCAATSRSRRTMDLQWVDKSGKGAGPGVLVRWALPFAPPFTGPYLPVERAAPGIDARSGRVYAGSTRGELWALDASGRKLYAVKAQAGIEAQPTVDEGRDEVYVATVRGTLFALRGGDGSERWKAELGAPVSQPGLLSEDAIYIVTDEDAVMALSRTDGSVLWRYRREPHEGFAISGHAGLNRVGNKLLTGFGDGAVVALDAGDGRLLWATDTSLDLEDLDSTRRFTDVDTTPVVVGDLVYAASFSGGLYGLELSTGTVRSHEGELRGVTSITATDTALLLSSAEAGVVCIDLPSLTLRWRHAIERGAPGKTEVRGPNVYVAESLGALLALRVTDGQELGRLETAHGITAAVSFEGRRGFALSNAGTLFAFTY
jgi:outer membrane protein assembly factor BamB